MLKYLTIEKKKYSKNKSKLQKINSNDKRLVINYFLYREFVAGVNKLKKIYESTL